MEKQKSMTYMAPGQGLNILLQVREFLNAQNGTASRLFNGSLTNAFVLRMAAAALSMLVANVRMLVSGVVNGWTAALLMVCVMTLVPALVEYSLNVRED